VSPIGDIQARADAHWIFANWVFSYDSSLAPNTSV
jgi:hypothetical protein